VAPPAADRASADASVAARVSFEDMLTFRWRPPAAVGYGEAAELRSSAAHNRPIGR
jgi:hypothetical protein